MKQFFYFLPLLVVLLPSALGYDDSVECINGIRTAIAEFTFSDNPDASYWIGVCNATLSITSIWAAAKLYCTPEEIVAGSTMLGDYCTEYGEVELTPYETILPNLTDAFIDSLLVVTFDDIEVYTMLNDSVLISKDFYDHARATTYTFEESYVIHKRLGWAMYGYWGGLLLIAILYRAGSAFYSSRLARNVQDVETTTPSRALSQKPSGLVGLFSTPYYWVKANLIIPAAFGSHHQRLYWGCTIPTRMETIIVFFYYAMSIILCGVDYVIFWPNLYYTTRDQALRYVADRTGVLSYANLPLLWMFSGRNNIFLWATGWNFSTFNIFHRHVARVATAQAIAHSICYSVLEADFGELVEAWQEHYWYMGGIATVAMSLLLVFSSVYLRQKVYELFLLIHIVLSVLTIVGVVYHVENYDGEYDGYLYTPVAIWVFDRFIRLVRQGLSNFRVKFSGKIHRTTATAIYDKDSDLIRLEVVPGSQMFAPKPNQHYFIYQPFKWRGWENHPFTLAAWSDVNSSLTADSLSTSQVGSESNIVEKTPASQERKPETITVTEVAPASPTAVVESKGLVTSPSSPEESSRQQLLFYLRPFSGWTSRLREKCLAQPNHTVHPTILIEGPYGHSAPLHTFDTVLFITGGTGISGALGYLTDHQNRTLNGGNTRTTNISLLWATKQSAMVRAITASKELAPILKRSDMTAEFHVTGKGEAPAVAALQSKQSQEKQKDEDGASSSSGSGSNSDNSIANTSYGRPNIRRAVHDVVASAEGRGDRIAVLVCGPAGMADEARAAVHKAMKEGRKGLDYFEETFGW